MLTAAKEGDLATVRTQLRWRIVDGLETTKVSTVLNISLLVKRGAYLRGVEIAMIVQVMNRQDLKCG